MAVAPLNEQQLAAVEATGEVFVSAGAGTGKTSVLVERFVRAVCDQGVDVDSILVITYTKRAAAELRERIRRALRERGRPDLARELDGAYISTIHGFCNRLLKAYPFEAGLDPRFRELDEAQASVLRSEAFDSALASFLEREQEERLRLLATYGAAGLRRMLIRVYETLRAAGRDLVLVLGEEQPLDERVAEAREAAQCLADDARATERQRENSAHLLVLLEEPRPGRLADLSDYRASGDRAGTYEQARKALEQAALDHLAAADRDLLQELLTQFADAYAAAKARESALDFEDLQLLARDLLRDNARIREQEQLRFRAIMVDEFQDTNRLQCELIDLLSRPWPATAPAGRSPAPPPPDAAGRTSLSGPVQSTVPSGDARPAAPQEREKRGPAEVFYVGDEFQSIYGFRHADVAVFRERRTQAGGGLALSQNYRSRPEVLAAVNYLFHEEFGDEFQPLHASGEFPHPVLGHPVELLVTEKATYADTDVHWRRAEARHIARRVRELVDTAAATPGEIVLLFAAGTDAEWYEEELRSAGLPTYRATGRGYFGQQQVVDLLSYLSLLQNRYDDRAVLAVLASPLVGVSNDTLALIRRAASKRPLFSGIERGVPEGVSDADARLLRAFRQRYDRLTAAAARASLERLLEQVIAEHDYDLAVLAQWDGKRRYANMRKLARLARSYEELRGPDIEGFVRFVREQEAVGARELEAVAEEEGADAVRLLTIHAAKGLEFKVVFVADAGREGVAPAADEILALSDGRFGFKVADPLTSRRRGAFGWEEVREARKAEERAERLRLYYVAMTRAIDRLIVSGAVGERDGETPIGWVLDRLHATEEIAEIGAAGRDPLLELERDRARFVVRVDRYAAPEPDLPSVSETQGEADRQLALFDQTGPALPPPMPALPALAPIPAPPLHRIRRLSFTALASFERCSYRYFAERVVGMRPRPVERGDGVAAVDIGSAVHNLLEHLDLRAPLVPDDLAERVRAELPAMGDDAVELVRHHVGAWCESELARRIAALDDVRPEQHFLFEHDDVLLHGYLDLYWRGGTSTLVVDYKTNVIGERTPAEIVDEEYRLQRLVYALACFRAGADTVEVVYAFLERPEEPVATTFTRDQVPELEVALSAAIEMIRLGDFRPTPSEWACAGCPALAVVCAGPGLLAQTHELAAFSGA
jgi:ATP-dependent exoDNAse (exonuclease V) beta subunit